MAVDVIIQRLEEAVDACTSLEAESKEAKEPLEALERQLGELAETLTSEGEEAEQAIDAAASLLTELRSRLETSGQQARGQIEVVVTRAKALEDEAERGGQEIRERLEELGTRQEELLAALRSGMDATEGEARELAGRVEALQAEIGEGLEAQLQAVDAFNGTVDEALQSLTQTHARWAEALAALGSAAAERTSEVGQGIGSLVQSLGHSLLTAGNGMIEEHNATMDRLWEGFAEEAPEMVASGLEAITAAIDSLEATRSAHSSELQSVAPTLAEKLRGVSEMLGGLDTDVGQSAERVPSL